MLDELCKICDRVSFGNVIRLGFGHWRHDDCAIGSESYHLYYVRQSKAIKEKLQEFTTYYWNTGRTK